MLISTYKSNVQRNLFLLASILLVLTPHFFHQQLLITIFNLTFLGWRALHELQLVQLPKKWLRTGLALASFAGVGLLYKSVLGLYAGSALLTIMLCLKLLEMHNWRDTAVVIGLGYFVAVTNFLYDQTLLMGAYLVVVVIVLTATLIVFNRTINSRETYIVIFRLATSLVLQAMPLAALLFFLFPRIPGPLWSLPDDAHSSLTGLSDSMSPGQISQLTTNESIAFRVSFKSAPPESSVRYWRGPVFNQFDGQTWRSDGIGIVDYKSTAIRLNNELLITDSKPAIDYDIILEPHNKKWLFALDIPTRIPDNAFLSANFELLKSEPIQQLIRYQVTSHIDYQLHPQPLTSAAQYLQLPKRSAPKARELVKTLFKQVSRSSDPQRALVDAVLDYFRTQPFIYSQKPPLLFADPVDEFLFLTRKGFCEHYASSFVVLMRAAGIPARVVTGYLGGDYNNVGSYLAVKQSDAHAWAEVWLNGQGWLRIDPTAVIPPERVEYTTQIERLTSESALALKNAQWLRKAWRKLSYSWDNINYYWKVWIIGYDDNQQNAFLAWLGWEDLDWQELTLILFSTLGGALLAIAAYLLSRNTEFNRDPVYKTYQRYCKKLAKLGITKQPGETAIQLTTRASHQRPELSTELTSITQYYNALRYSAHPQQNLLHNFKKAVAGLKIKSPSR